MHLYPNRFENRICLDGLEKLVTPHACDKVKYLYESIPIHTNMPIYIYLNKYIYTNMPMHIPIHSYIRVRGHTFVNIILRD